MHSSDAGSGFDRHTISVSLSLIALNTMSSVFGCSRWVWSTATFTRSSSSRGNIGNQAAGRAAGVN